MNGKPSCDGEFLLPVTWQQKTVNAIATERADGDFGGRRERVVVRQIALRRSLSPQLVGLRIGKFKVNFVCVNEFCMFQSLSD